MKRADGPVRDEDARRRWMLAHAHCQACGVPAFRARPPGHSVHHIIKPGRSDEPCNLLLLCHYCHEAAENRAVIGPDGLPVPRLSWRACLTLKMFREPAQFSLTRVSALLYTLAPAFEKFPRRLEQRYRHNRPAATDLFVPDAFLL